MDGHTHSSPSATTNFKKVGYWMTEKKIRRLNFEAFESLCRSSRIELIKLNFERPLEEQGPFDAIIHKLTDQLARTQDGSEEALKQINLVHKYISEHKDMKVIDPIENVLRLCDRRQQYEYVQQCDVVDANYHYFIPAFAELTTSNVEENRRLVVDAGVEFPLVSKPSLSHVANTTNQVEREEMAIIFSESGLVDIDPPCVVQTFVNHNARLFKIFIVGSRYFIIERPSIKNFHTSDHKTIFFNSNDVSKSYSSSFLNVMDEHDINYPIIEPDDDKLLHLVSGVQRQFGLDLLGIDVIIENCTGRYAVIDINAFPGYDGVDEFFPALLQLIEQKMSVISPSYSGDGTNGKRHLRLERVSSFHQPLIRHTVDGTINSSSSTCSCTSSNTSTGCSTGYSTGCSCHLLSMTGVSPHVKVELDQCQSHYTANAVVNTIHTVPCEPLNTATTVNDAVPGEPLNTATTVNNTVPREPLNTATAVNNTVPGEPLNTATAVNNTVPREPLNTATAVNNTVPGEPLNTATAVNNTVPGEPLNTATAVNNTVPGEPLNTATAVNDTVPREPLNTATAVNDTVPGEPLNTATTVNNSVPHEPLNTATTVNDTVPREPLNTATTVNNSDPCESTCYTLVFKDCDEPVSKYIVLSDGVCRTMCDRTETNDGNCLPSNTH